MTNPTLSARRFDVPDLEPAPHRVPPLVLPEENPSLRAFFRLLKSAGSNPSLVGQIARLRDSVLAAAIGNRETKSGTVIALTGPRGKEGTSQLSLLLVRSLGNCRHRRVAWIDGSFDHQRFRVMTRIFGLSPNAIRFTKGTSEVVGYANESAPNTCFLRSPSTETSLEFFSDQRVGLFLSDVRRQFDFVVIDMPPLMNGTANLFLLPLLDRLYLVTVPRKTTVDEVRHCQSTAEKAGGQISGVILNKQTVPIWGRMFWKSFFA